MSKQYVLIIYIHLDIRFIIYKSSFFHVIFSTSYCCTPMHVCYSCVTQIETSEEFSASFIPINING